MHLPLIKAELLDIVNLYLAIYDFISNNFDCISQNCEFISRRCKLTIVRKKSEL